MSKNKNIYTRAVHAGEQRPSPDFIPVSTPVYNASTYFYTSMEDLDAIFAQKKKGFVYTRYGNPTNTALEEAVAALEGGEAACTFSSGMAAIHAALLATGLEKGDSVVAAHDLYGATYTLLNLFTQLGIHIDFVDISDLEQVEAVVQNIKPKALIFEVMSNPLLKIADVPHLIEIAHTYSAQVVVDSTFTTPYLITPLEYNADYVMHSLTKYINGHGDVLGGVVICSEEKKVHLYELTKLLGANLGPNEAFLTLRGLKTLPLRMARHCDNAVTMADFLSEHPKIGQVIYPGLKSHPQHKLASQLFRKNCYGGMVSFEIKNAGQEEIFTFFESLNLVLPATSLGDIYSLMLYPAHSSHRGLTPEERQKIGISEGLVRFSVGIEDPADIVADVEQALDKM
ncbi:MAG: aminotransferase class I/II-fold pyridoxal phosphate-dependent enzyme [Theionarchaea archaeon]|nr:aminotransferase class I/II-fold pyridoxal phosphate-dependent enzyme [Theionarchaea archaeon]